MMQRYYGSSVIPFFQAVLMPVPHVISTIWLKDFKVKTVNVNAISTTAPVVLCGIMDTCCNCFLCSALSQEDDDAQLKIEDILQMVSTTICCYHNVMNREDSKISFKQLSKIIYLQKSCPLLHFIVVRILLLSRNPCCVLW